MRCVPCEIYSRVVGYFRPVSQWNPGKRAEFWDRLPYKMEVPSEHTSSQASQTPHAETES